jgi:hypothetical protein
MNRDLDRILDECLDRLNSGQSPEECLRLYPEFAEELAPLLMTVGEVRARSAFMPSEAAKIKGRARLFQAINEIEQEQSVPKVSVFQWLFSQPRIWAPVAVTVLVAIIIGLTTIFPVGDDAPEVAIVTPTVTPGDTASPGDTAETPIVAYAGILELQVTDAPAYDISAVEVTISNIEVCCGINEEEAGDEGTGWTTVIDGSKTFELLALRGTEMILGSLEFESGHYTQIRMNIEEVIVTVNGEARSASLPDGKLLLIDSFDIENGVKTTILLDFDAEKSVVITESGEIVFEPVVGIKISYEPRSDTGDASDGDGGDVIIGDTGEGSGEGTGDDTGDDTGDGTGGDTDEDIGEGIDDDDDGVPTEDEDVNGNGDLTDDDTDNDGIPDYRDDDDDNDGVPTKDEDVNANGDPTDDDTDNDGIPDDRDDDDDNDGVPTKDEDVNANGDPTDDDTDNDGIPDYQDDDDDNDGIPTKDEDANGNGDPTDDDTDNDGIPDYQDDDDEDNEDTPPPPFFTGPPSVSGGAFSLFVNCIEINGDGRYTVYYGYHNSFNRIETLDLSNLRQASGSAYDPDWNDCVPITINNGGSELTDYQVKVILPYKPEMQPDFNDIRFTDSDATTELSYWRESYTASSSAVFWVKVPSIPAGDKLICACYGNPAASSASNGDATFIFFDDFSGNLSKWTIHRQSSIAPEYPRIENGYLVCGGGTKTSQNPYSYGHTVVGSAATYTGFQNGIIEGKLLLAENGVAEIGFRGEFAGDTGYKARWDERDNGHGYQGKDFLKPPYTPGVWQNICGEDGEMLNPNTWFDFRVAINGSVFKSYTNGTTEKQCSDSDYSSAGEISLQNHYGDYSYYDDVRVRKYADTEPITSVGDASITGNPLQALQAGTHNNAFAATAPIGINIIWTAKAGLTIETVTASSDDTICTP